MMFYFKVKDNISDGNFIKKMLMYLLLPYALIKYRKAEKMYPEVALMISESMRRQTETEKIGTDITDKAAHESADVLGRILAYNLPDEKGSIYRFGYGVGKFVYLSDAADDIEKDIKHKSYNPFVKKFGLTSSPTEEAKKDIEHLLNMSAGIVCEAFSQISEKTLAPIVENIIYDGMENTMNNILKGKEKNERSL